MKKIYLIANLVFGISVFAQNANVSLSNLSSNNGYSSYNTSSKQISGIFFEVLSDGNNSNNLIDDFETSLYLLSCDASGTANSSTPIIIKTYNVSGFYQMHSRDYSGESVDLSQVNNLSDGTYRMGVWVNSNNAIPNPPDDPNDNAALLRSDAGTASGSVINYSSSGQATGITQVSGDNALISVYPNPASDKITFLNATSGIITISDISGRVMEIITLTEKNTSLNLSNYKTGIYFYQLKNNNKVVPGKFIKE